jgi:hypothetical protein
MCEVLLKITFLEIGVYISVLMCTIRTRLYVLLIAKIIGRCMYVVSEIQSVYKRMARFKKLTRNLFLTLHGQNVHRQQRQLSKIFMH